MSANTYRRRSLELTHDAWVTMGALSAESGLSYSGVVEALSEALQVVRTARVVARRGEDLGGTLRMLRQIRQIADDHAEGWWDAYTEKLGLFR